MWLKFSTIEDRKSFWSVSSLFTCEEDKKDGDLIPLKHDVIMDDAVFANRMSLENNRL